MFQIWESINYMLEYADVWVVLAPLFHNFNPGLKKEKEMFFPFWSIFNHCSVDLSKIKRNLNCIEMLALTLIEQSKCEKPEMAAN